MFLSVIFCK